MPLGLCTRAKSFFVVNQLMRGVDMDQELNAEDIGQELGDAGVGSLVQNVEEFCVFETRRIELVNQARIVALRAEGSLLVDEEEDLKNRLRHAPPVGDIRTRRARIIYYGAVALALIAAGFYFSLLAFDPYRLGAKSYVYCLGIALVTPFLVEQALERWHAEKLVKWLTALGAVVAVASLVMLAVIRGDLFAALFKMSASIVDGADPGTPQLDFYASTLTLLRLVMALVALAMELGSGLALRETWRLIADKSEDWNALRTRLAQVRERLIAVAQEATALQNEPAVFAARFWRNFHRAMLTATLRSSMTKVLLVLVAFLAVARPSLATQNHTTLVVAIDLTQSVAVRGPDGMTEFQKDVDGVTKLLGELPAGSYLTVIGITDRTFSQPYILLKAGVPDDPGYFGERLRAARTELIQVWKRRSAEVEAGNRASDILGAVSLAAQIFENEPVSGRKILVLFSDMRHHTVDLNLESPRMPASLSQPSKGITGARLVNVEVYALGVDGAGKPAQYWDGLRKIWTEYLVGCGATVRAYSVLRDVAVFGR